MFVGLRRHVHRMMAGLGVLALRQMRTMTEKKASALEPVMNNHTPPHRLSRGRPARSRLEIGMRTALQVPMRLNPQEIQQDHGRHCRRTGGIVVLREGSIGQRAELAVRELEATGGLPSIICIASPTGVGYVNYVMAEARVFRPRHCAPSSRSTPMYQCTRINKTTEGVELQTAVIGSQSAAASTR